jgi:deoxyribodipyrimidine photolyase-related protein
VTDLTKDWRVTMETLTIILGNQLFDLDHYKDFPENVFMAEDEGLCTHFKYHKHKIIHFLASMRTYADSLSKRKFKVHYNKLDESKGFLFECEKLIIKNKVKEIHIYEIEDKFFEEQLFNLFLKLDVKVKVYDSPMFMCSRNEFFEYLESVNKPLLNTFYIGQRQKYGILVEKGSPVGGQWNFDQDNRKKIPLSFEIEKFIPPTQKSKHIEEVKGLVNKRFSGHPGSVDNFWIPVDRQSSIKWLKNYLDNRFKYFGDFQDSLDQRTPFLYHSLISPLINIGFLTPFEVVKEVESMATKENLNSVEGFIRQIMGWREFVRGIYQNCDEFQQTENFFNHKNRLNKCWYKANTGVTPLDDAIKKANEWGYCHHIERLMVIGNLMLLLEVHPQEVYRWFMEMFVDSSDWVMGPNVFGMSQFSDGGVFATKPYISGSNYIFKMGNYKKNEQWATAWDGLYWRFIDRKRSFLSKNHRLNMMVKMFDKMDDSKKQRIFKEADKLEEKVVF